MISLQQIEVSQYCPDEHMTVAIHRRSSTMLSLHRETHTLFASRQSGGNRVWAIKGSFKLPPTPHVIGFYNLEAYNAFMILYEHKSSTRASFIDLSCNVINTWDLDNSCNCLVGGYDQNRKDLILAAKNGDVKAFTVRLVKSVIHVIYRCQIRIPKKNRSAPIQIASQDVCGSFLILTVTGSISCWDTSQLECLWIVESTRFRCPPTKLFPDKFGPNFAVLCVNNQTGKQSLEIWSPPSDFIDCGSNTFLRYEIPLKTNVVSLSLETVGGDFGTALMVIQNNRHAQLWTLANGLITQHCDLICTGDATSFSGCNDLDVGFPGHEDQSHEINFLKMFSLGQGCFTDGFGCPANEVLYLGLSESDFCLLALHSPTKGDLVWQETIALQTLSDGMADQYGNNKSEAPLLAQFGQSDVHDKAISNSGYPRHENNPTLLDDDSAQEETYSLSDFYQGDPQTQPASQIEQQGKVFAFTPSAAIPTLNDKIRTPNTLMQIIKPRGLAVLSDNKGLSFPQLHRLTRSGLLRLSHPQDSIPAKSELEIDKVSIAYRSERMVCITDIKEGFVFDMHPFSGKSEPTKPIRLEVGISPNAKCTTILACDVFIKLPPDVLLNEGIKAPIEGSGLMGSHVLAMFGDSDGKIFYSLCSHQSVLQQGFIRAHSKPVVALVSTGDCMKPIWKIGTSLLNKKSPQLKPTTMPGSGIISMDCSGEVKVWQPLFSNSGVLRSKQSQILSIYQLSWYLSGLINTRESGLVDKITHCCLDPTCTTVFIGFDSGRIQQWVVPGITSNGSNKAQIIREDVWESRKHGTSISSMRFWVNVQDTSVRARSVDFGKLNDPKISKSAKYAAIITDNTNIALSNEGHIAYTLEELRRIAENSTFVTAAKDNTIILWRLFVTKAMPLPSDITELKSQKLFTDCRFLEPIKCQIFTVSATPTEALCYPLQPQGGIVHWRLSVLVGGIIISLAQGEKTTLFLPKSKQVPQIVSEKMALTDTVSDNDSVAVTVLDYDSSDMATIDKVDAMPVICEVVNSQKTVAHMSLSGVPCRLSWKHPWQKDTLEIPVQNVFVDTGEGANSNNMAVQLATLSPSRSPIKPVVRLSTTDMTDILSSPPKQYTVGTTLVTPEKPIIKKVDKDALLKQEASKKGKKIFKRVATKPLPTDSVAIQHAGIKMRVPVANVDHLDQITPGNHTKKYYASKSANITPNGANSGLKGENTSRPSFSGNIAPNLRPPSPPGGTMATLTSMTLESQPGIRSGVSVLNVEGHSTRSSPTHICSIPPGPKGAIIDDDTESVMNDDTTAGDTIVDMETLTQEYLTLQTTGKSDPLIKSKDKAKPKISYISKSSDKSWEPKSIKQPYRNAVVGSVPAPKEALQRGEYQNTRFVARSENMGTNFQITGEPETSKDMLKFKMYVNPIGDDMPPSPSRTNLHKFGSKKEVEELAETYSYFKNPRNYFEKLSEPMFYQKGAKERGEDARDLQSQLEDMNIVYSDMDSDGSGDDDDDASIDVAKVDKIKDSMISSELQLYSSMSVADKKEFLKNKRRENQRVMRESKDAFKELAGFEVNRMKSADGSDDAMDQDEEKDQEQIDKEEAALNEAMMKTKITSRKVLGWGSVIKAVNVGISMKAINDMMSESSVKKRNNKNPPANLNMKEFTTFAKKLNKVIAENEVPPIIETIIVDTLHDRVDISLQSSKPGRAYIAVYEEKASAPVPVKSDFRNRNTLLFRYEGCVSVTEEKLPHTNKVFLTLKGLDPLTKYKIVVCGEHNDGKFPCRSENENIKKAIVKFVTERAPPENMNIEWGRLSIEHKYDELVAAACDLSTQAKAEQAKIVVPSTDDIEEWMNVVEEADGDDDLKDAELDDDGDLSPYGVTKRFLDWWTNNDPEFGESSHRTDFLTRESLFYVKNQNLIHQCADEKYLSIEQSELLKQVVEEGGDVSLLPAYLIFRSWLKGGRIMDEVFLGLKKKRRLEQFEELRLELKNREISNSRVIDDDDDFASGEIKPTIPGSGDEDCFVDDNVDQVPAIISDSVLSDDEENVVKGNDDANVETAPLLKKRSMVDVSDLVYEEDFDEIDPREIQLRDRSIRLEECAQKVEDSITLVNGLLMAQRHAEEEDLAVEDLERRRGLLRYEDVITIMAMKKLKELCEKKNIRPRDLDESNTQVVTGASTFVEVPDSELTPEEPPQATMLSLVGSAKRPLRSWEGMTLQERILEMQMACMLIDISELAVESGISIPNPEDGNILSSSLVIPSRIQRWENYENWYVGNETSTNIKKKRPSLARIMFADWEKKSVKKDLAFQDFLKKRPTEPKKKLLADDGSVTAGPSKLSKQKSSKRLSTKRMSSANLDMPNYTRSTSAVGSTAGDEDDEIVQTYEAIINKDATVRCKYLTQLLKVALKSRNMGMLRLLMPPAWPGRMHSQFMFPRLGMITPCYTEPVPRFQPNPSFSTESYSVAEVMLWFSKAELDLDDDRMRRAEVEGKKRQAYLEWLADEEDRMLAGRIMMRREDVFSHHLRHHTNSIEVDPPMIESDGTHKNFIHNPSLPGDYSHLEENDRYFEDKTSCGIDNEDEVEDILEQMRYEAESALRAKKEMKKKKIEERKRKEEEDKKRQELQERDQRIEENKDRLVKLRKHLENLKESRLQEKEAKEREIKDALTRQEREMQEMFDEKEKQRLIRVEQTKVDKEVKQMMKEDEIHHIQRDHLREFASMEHEDILGLMMREQRNSAEKARMDRIHELEEIYEDFVPFRFEKSKIRVPHLHVDDEPEDESRIVLPEKIDWKLLKDPVSDHKQVSKGARLEKYDINSVFYGNDKNDEILEKLLFSDSNKFSLPESMFDVDDENSISDIGSKKYWPRATATPPMTTPLVWKGPDKKNDKPKQLRKKERPYTNFNSSELYLQKVLKIEDTNKIVFLETSTDNTLHSLGMEKELIRSFGQREEIVRLPPLTIKQSEDLSLVTSKKSPKTSFMDPVVFRPTLDGLSIDSPSANNTMADNVKNNERSHPIAARTISNAPNTYRVKTPKGKARKDDSKSITSEKDALKKFIKENSIQALDPFFVAACEPGLREADVLTMNEKKKKLKVSASLPVFKPMAQDQVNDVNVGKTNVLNDYVKENVTDILKDSGFIGDDQDRAMFLAEVDSNSSTAQENRHIVDELKSSIAATGSNIADIDFDDDILLQPRRDALDDPVFRITDRNVVYEPNKRIIAKNTYQQHEEHHPAFYRRPFGVKGHIKPIDEDSFIVRARKSAEAQTAANLEKERKEQRNLMKKSQEERAMIEKKQKKKNGTTVKSLHRDEYAALLRKSFEETSRQYDCRNVNFANNKGL